LTSFAPASAQGWFARAVFGLDVWLRRWQGVFEYTSDPDCIFRLELRRLQETVVLADGTTFPADARIAELHLWNEQIPKFPAAGATLQWAHRMHRCVDASLQDLASFLGREHELRQVVAVRAEMGLVAAEHAERLLRICAHYGFRSIQRSNRPPWRTRLRHQGENMLIASMVLARNPQAFRLDCFRRSRIEIFLPRAVLDGRYRQPSVRHS
jgi:hypothetical protein